MGRGLARMWVWLVHFGADCHCVQFRWLSSYALCMLCMGASKGKQSFRTSTISSEFVACSVQQQPLARAADAEGKHTLATGRKRTVASGDFFARFAAGKGALFVSDVDARRNSSRTLLDYGKGFTTRDTHCNVRWRGLNCQSKRLPSTAHVQSLWRR